MDLRTTQLKDTYGNLVTTGTTAGAPTSGGLQNGQGTLLTSVGIGTNTPAEPFDLQMDSISGLKIGTNANGGATLTTYQGSNNSNVRQFQINCQNFEVNTGSPTGTSTSNALLIDSSGNVGIGETNPSNKLEVNSGSTQTVSVFKASSTSAVANNGGALIGIRNTNDTDGNMEGLFFQNSNGNSTSGIIGYNVNHSTNEGLMTFGVRNSSGTFGEKMRIDSNGNVGIGVSPSATLHIDNPANPTSLRIGNNTTDDCFIMFNTDGNDWAIGADRSASNSFKISDNSTLGTADRLIIDTSGNVKINNGVLELGGEGIVSGYINSEEGLYFNVDSNATPEGSVFVWGTGRTGSSGGTERMRIDGSGNVIVGNTSYNNDNVGVGLGASGFLYATRDGSLVSSFNRLTSDGTIADFRKDGTVVGSIGAYSGDLWIGQGNTGLLFNDGSDVLRPANASGGNRDGNYDLGASDSRFKDLYLSGSVYLGGTGSANALDDYEEGTFDLTLKGSTSDPTIAVTTTANYTKIGNVVHYNFRFDNVDTTGASGNITFSAFPFTTTSTNNAVGSVSVFNMADFNGTEYLNLFTGETSTQAEVLGSRTNNSWLNAQHNAGTGRYFIASITVHVV